MNFFDSAAFQILLVIAAYFLGSINSAILVSRARCLPDPRTLGSGNPGATNMLRAGSKFDAAVTLFGDLLKGFIPVFITRVFIGDEHLVAVVGLAALLGHIYPIYYRFKGGKGVATTLGILLGLDWLLGVLWLLVWVGVAFLSRYSSLAALVATVLTPVFAWLLQFGSWEIGLLAMLVLFIYWRHRSNIGNLLSGNEPKLSRN